MALNTIKDVRTQQLIDILNDIAKEINISSVEYYISERVWFYCKGILLPHEKKPDTIYHVVLHYLYRNSKIFNTIIETKEKVVDELMKYIQKTIEKYIEVYDYNYSKFDGYVEDISSTPREVRIYTLDDLKMDINDISNTIILLADAVRIYFELYHQKKLVVVFNENEQKEFKILENQIAHLLGIELKKILNSEKLMNFFGITTAEKEAFYDYTKASTAALDILLKIVEINPGDLQLLQFDRYTKLLNGNYQYRLISTESKDVKEDLDIINYKKIHVKSKAFINYKPLDRVSLIIDLPDKYRIHENPNIPKKKNTLLVSKNELSNKYKYSTLISVDDLKRERRYFESLIVTSEDDLLRWENDAISISKSTNVYVENESSSIRRSTSFLRLVDDRSLKIKNKTDKSLFESIKSTDLLVYEVKALSNRMDNIPLKYEDSNKEEILNLMQTT